MGEDNTSSTRVSVYEAAAALHVTVDAIRKRISRGTIPHERDEHGRVWVILDEASKVQDTDQDTYQPQPESDALISEMRGRIEDLRTQLEAERKANEENRRIIAALTSRIPELPPAASQEPREEATEATEQPGRVGPQTTIEGAQEPREYAVTPEPHPRRRAEPPESVVTDEQAEEAVRGAQEGAERPWWRRMFGG